MLKKEQLLPKIHYSTFICTALIFAWNLNLGTFYLMLLFVTFLHELGHAYFANLFKLNTGAIHIFPIGGILSIEGKTSNIKQIIILFMGPFVNFVLAMISVIFMNYLNSSIAWYNYLVIFFFANAISFVFNILPIFPLDGGQILFYSLFCFFDKKLSMVITLTVSIVLACIMLAYSLYYSNFLMIISLMFMFVLGKNQVDYIMQDND